MNDISAPAHARPTDPAADGDAIRRLLADYCHLVDDGEHDRWVELFTPDAELEIGRRTHQGHEALLAWIRAIADAAELPTRHLVANPAIDLLGDEADVLSDLVLVSAAMRVEALGRYRDRLVRSDDGRWRIARRRIELVPPAGSR